MNLRKINLDKNSWLHETLESIKRTVNNMEEAEAYMYLIEESKAMPGDSWEYSEKEKHGVPIYEDERIYCRFVRRAYGWEYECFEKVHST